MSLYFVILFLLCNSDVDVEKKKRNEGRKISVIDVTNPKKKANWLKNIVYRGIKAQRKDKLITE